MPEKRAVPETIKIMGRTWKVNFIDHNSGMTGGSCLNLKQEIDVSDNLCPQQQKATLMHEVFEGINGDLNLDLDHTQITILSELINQVVISNPLEIWQTHTKKV